MTLRFRTTFPALAVEPLPLPREQRLLLPLWHPVRNSEKYETQHPVQRAKDELLSEDCQCRGTSSGYPHTSFKDWLWLAWLVGYMWRVCPFAHSSSTHNSAAATRASESMRLSLGFAQTFWEAASRLHSRQRPWRNRLCWRCES